MEEVKANYWLSKTQKFIESKALDTNLPEHIKQQIASYYSTLTKETAQATYDIITTIEGKHNAERHMEFAWSMLKVSGSTMIMGGAIVVGGHLLQKMVSPTSKVYKWADYGQMIGTGIALLGMVMFFAIGH